MTTQSAHRLKADTITNAALRWGADSTLAAAVADNVMSGASQLFATRGWAYSGKDTVAPLTMDALGASEPVHALYAEQLKDVETATILTCVREAGSPAAAADAIRRRLPNVPPEVARHVVDGHAVCVGDGPGRRDVTLWDAVREDLDLGPRDRHPIIRWALQYWGTNFRREQDTDYWVKATLLPLLPKIADGQSVMITDVRFPNEVELAQQIGFFVVSLLITREEQARRAWDRDGIVLDMEAMQHGSETALDDYDGFDLEVWNQDRPPSDTVDEIVAAIRNR